MGTEWAIVVCGINDPVCQSAIPLRVFGSIEHLNELEQRNIGIRRGPDCLARATNPPSSCSLCIRFFIPFTAAPSFEFHFSFFFSRRVTGLCHAALIFSRDQGSNFLPASVPFPNTTARFYITAWLNWLENG